MAKCFQNGVWLSLEGYIPVNIEIVYTDKVNWMMYKHSEQFFIDTCI